MKSYHVIIALLCLALSFAAGAICAPERGQTKEELILVNQELSRENLMLSSELSTLTEDCK